MFRIVATIVVAVFLMAGGAFAQPTGSAPSSAITEWGDPDLQGVWDFGTMTPLERPEDQADKAFLTEEEAAAASAAVADRIARESEPSEIGRGALAVGDTNAAGRYNEFWLERATNVVGDRRTSLIIDPPNGRLPPLTPEGEASQQLGNYWTDVPLGPPVRVKGAGSGVDNPEERGLSERCLIGFNTGPPMMPGAYNNNMQLFQTPDTVVIYNEMVHDARIVSLDGRSHVPEHIRQWMGDARGHWDGDILVVETTNFTDKTGSFDPNQNTAIGSGLTLHLTERFRRLDEDTLLYEYTVNDPTTFTQPFTVALPMRRSDNPMYEYACHEGNRGLEVILSGGANRRTRP
jgi:hypothetical protein